MTGSAELPAHFAAYDNAHGRPWALIAAQIEARRALGWQWRYVADDAALPQAAEALAGLSEPGWVIPASSLGFHASPFQMGRILARLRALVTQALGDGAAGLLLLVELGWTVRTPPGAIYHKEYEAGVHELVSQLPAAVVCLHPRHLMLGGQLLAGLQMHPQVLTTTGAARPNPHFVLPKLLVRQDERGQFQHWLEGLDPALRESTATPAGQRAVQYTTDAHLPLVTVASGGKWKIRTFGGLRVYREDGTPLNWQVSGGATRKLKMLFAFLLFRAEQGATPEELVELLWPDLDDLDAGLNRLYQSVTSLRRVLAQSGGDGKQFLRQDSGRYLLAVPEHTWLDFPMFQELCFQGAALDREGDATEAITAYQSAERLYTGEFLLDMPLENAGNATLEWCWNRRFWFRDMHLKAVTNLARLYRRQGQLSEAQAACDTVLRVEPTFELAQEEKLLAYAAAGRPDAVRRQYRMYAQALERSGLGEPSVSVRELVAQLLA